MGIRGADREYIFMQISMGLHARFVRSAGGWGSLVKLCLRQTELNGEEDSSYMLANK